MASSSAAQILVAHAQRLDLADGMQHGGVVAAAEYPADHRQRIRRQVFGQKPRDLTQPYDVGGAACGNQVGERHPAMACDRGLNLLDAQPGGRTG
jgi:hypothetical protein